jgi:hypothetical protein
MPYQRNEERGATGLSWMIAARARGWIRKISRGVTNSVPEMIIVAGSAMIHARHMVLIVQPGRLRIYLRGDE